VCHDYTHRKPHHFLEYVHCNRQINSGKNILPIDKQQTGQSKKTPTTKSPDDAPEGLNNSKKKETGRGSYLKEKSSARGLTGTADNSTSRSAAINSKPAPSLSLPITITTKLVREPCTFDANPTCDCKHTL
jgi:hypothetical protein